MHSAWFRNTIMLENIALQTLHILYIFVLRADILGFFWLKNGLDNLVPRALIRVEHEAEGPGKGWLSHDQIFQYIWKIFLANYRVLNFFDKFSKYIEKFGHVTTSICQGLCRHIFHHKEERG